MTFGGPHHFDPPSRERQANPSATNSSFDSMLAKRTLYSPPPAPQAPERGPGLPEMRVPRRRGRVARIWILSVLAFVLIALAGYYLYFLGTGAATAGLVLALIPLTIVLIGIRMVDRWEPEPKSMVIFALAWGAVAAVALTLLVDIGLTWLVGARPDALVATAQAPLVEELTKGLGVFLIYVTSRRFFDGPVDGVVYGALVGAGFAFTENIQYFAVSVIEGGSGQLAATFVLRGLLSPFAHVMFTACTGYAFGLAARRGKRPGAALRSGVIGLLFAIALHAFWNFSSVVGNFFSLYAGMQVPLFVGFIIGIILLRREEARLTQLRLGEYAEAGWFTPQEVTMLATPAGRKSGLRWAASLREDRRGLMKVFIKDATALAAVRQRAVHGRDRFTAVDERTLLARTQQTRAALLAY